MIADNGNEYTSGGWLARARSGAALRTASSLWPSNDSVDFARRDAIASLSASDLALGSVIDLHQKAVPRLFEDLAGIWIHPTPVEVLLSLELHAIRDAARHLEHALDLLVDARMENNVRSYDERIRDGESVGEQSA
jgi:hypothetical protein